MTVLKKSMIERVENKLGAIPEDVKISKSYMVVTFIALLVGGILGLVQGLNRAGLLEIPNGFNYYQILTAHGILLILIFTAFFYYWLLLCWFVSYFRWFITKGKKNGLDRLWIKDNRLYYRSNSYSAK